MLRVAAAAPRSEAIGVDTDEPSLAEARNRAAARGLAARATFLSGDGALSRPGGGGRPHLHRLHPGLGTDRSRQTSPSTTEVGLRRHPRRGPRTAPGSSTRTASGRGHRPSAATAPLSGRDDEFVQPRQGSRRLAVPPPPPRRPARGPDPPPRPATRTSPPRRTHPGPEGRPPDQGGDVVHFYSEVRTLEEELQPLLARVGVRGRVIIGGESERFGVRARRTAAPTKDLASA